eukprot:1162094-Pelagomonas_calceolata.AAC.4
MENRAARSCWCFPSALVSRNNNACAKMPAAEVHALCATPPLTEQVSDLQEWWWVQSVCTSKREA